MQQSERKLFILNDAKKLGQLALPYVFAKLLSAANWALVILIIARLGKETLSASALAYSTVITVQLTAWAMIYALVVLIGKAYAEKQFLEVGSIVRSSVVISLGLGSFFGVLLWYSDYFLIFIGQDKHLVTLITPYLKAMAFSLLPSILYISACKLGMGIGKPKLMFFTMLLGVPFNVVLTYILVFGKFGSPIFGFVGAAYANICMYSAMFFGLLLYFINNKEFKKFLLFDGRVICWQHIKRIFYLGLPISLEWGVMAFVYAISTYMIGWLGVTSLAAHQSVAQWTNLVIMVPYAMTHAIAVVVAQALGAKRKKYIREINFVGITLTLSVVLVAVLVYVTCPNLLLSAYVNVKNFSNGAILHLAKLLFLIMAVTQIIDTVSIVTTGALRGFSDTSYPMVASVFSQCLISVPCAYFLGIYLSLGTVGIYVGYIMGSMVNAVCLLTRWQRKFRV